MTDIGAMSPAKRALLERALRRRREEAAAATAIPRRQDTGPAVLSFAQQRMWFLQQWEPGSPTFNGARAIRLRGPLDRAALRWAFERVVERHEILRTVISGDRDPRGVVLEDFAFELPVIELDDEARLEPLLHELSREPFDLTADLTLRASLIVLGPDDYVLLVRGHHISADAHSDHVMFGELSELYSAHTEGREPSLPELPIQYADFAAWQREHLTGKLLDDLVSYWRAQLDGAPALLRLPTDRPRPAVQRHAGAHRRFMLERGLADQLLTLSRSEGVTFYITMLAAFATLLYRLGGEDDIVIGSPIASRNNVELQGLVGFFTNTIALRCKLAGNPSFRTVLARARETALGAYAHQELPFDKVVEAVAPKRDPSYNPLFQVNFRAQATERPRLMLRGLETEHFPVDIGFSRFDLALELELRADALAGFFEYDEDLFDPATIDGFVEDLRSMLEQLMADPDAPILAARLREGRAARPATPGGTIARRRQT
jgi:hypothetical protein